jgi:CRISPR/Cas system CMR-associated protein Cmr5 small subunit
MTIPPRVDHGLARLAAQTLDAIRDPRGQVSDQIITRLKGLPALLRTSGPLPTLVFFASKAGRDKPLERAYAVVGNELRVQFAAEIGDTVSAGATFTEFMLALTDQNIPADALARASARLEEFALWLRRLAEATEREQQRSRPPVSDDHPGGQQAAPAEGDADA